MVRFEYRWGLTSIAVAGVLWMSCARGNTDEIVGDAGSGGTSSMGNTASAGTGGAGGMSATSSGGSTGTGTCMSTADCPAGEWCSGFACIPCNDDQHCGATCTDCLAIGSTCGPSMACIECMMDADCGQGSYCDAGGLCAPCDTGQKCGPTCMACSGTTPDCDGTACVCNATSCDPNQMCTSGICEVCKTDAACGPMCTACSSPTPLCLDQGTTSQCVECLSPADCTPGLMCVGNICGDACTLSGKSYDFESGDQGFTHVPTSGMLADDPWARGTPGAVVCHSGTNCWATSLSAVGYTDCQTAALLSPVIDLSPCAGLPQPITLSFWHYYQFEPQSSNRWWDGGVLQLSADGGTSWTDITTSQPYQGLIDGSYTLCTPVPEISGHQGWSGPIPAGMWVEVTVDLPPAYRVATFRIRWLFGADEALTARGWIIDDVAVTPQ